MKAINRALLDLAEFGYIFVKSKSQAKAVAKRCDFPVTIKKTAHDWYMVSIGSEPKPAREFKKASWILIRVNQFLFFLIKLLDRFKK